MLNNFRNLQSLLGSHGSRWLMFRIGYALRKRTGLIRLRLPIYQWQDRPLGTWLKNGIPSKPESYAEWRKQNSPKFFLEPLHKQNAGRVAEGVHLYLAQVQVPRPWNPQTAVDEAERIRNGELKYFAHQFVKTGFPPDWHKDPVSGKKLDLHKHWSEISDDGEVDTKFIWEASRFGVTYTLVRAYAFARDEKYAEAFWELIQSWAESNPPNQGPNWMDGQEAALRLMAWSFAFYAFIDSPSSTSERIAQFTVMVAAHAERIYKNIDYAISTHSNHTISEGFGLWLVGLLFPELKDAQKYFELGRRLLEQEAAAQIFPDGTYSMYSLNYHRFILQLYLYAIRLGELNDFRLSATVLSRISKSVDTLYQLVDTETGQMPVYGSNDGALVLPLNNCDFNDYRPLLQLGSYVTKRQFLFEPGAWDEDVFWLYGADSISQPRSFGGSEKAQASFPDGGTYTLSNANSKAVIRCTDYKARPSHADQLHMDLWIRGQNVACDAGTYLYSGEGPWRNGLAHTSVHNTVTIDGNDQMKMVSRFTWTNWSKGNVIGQNERLWQGEHDSYKPVTHKRTVMALEGDRWLVIDNLHGKQNHHYALHWLLNDVRCERKEDLILFSLDEVKYKVELGLLAGKSTFSVVRGDPNSTRGWRSRYYGDKEPAISLMLDADQQSVCFWSYFGLELDQLELVGKTLNISGSDWKTKINLDELNK